jgi:23S rRNA (adenine2503-C2)-methyltransferase
MPHTQIDTGNNAPPILDIMAATCSELATGLKRRYSIGQTEALALYRHVFKNGHATLPRSTLSAKYSEQVAKDLLFPYCRITGQQTGDGVIKFVTAMYDNTTIESVIIPSNGRITLCVSSQVGCAMGCTFCMTGRMGFTRDLKVHEIVWQVWAARFLLHHSPDNVVFMGMGEPLDNFDNVIQSIRVMSDQRGLDIAPRHITVSTAGHADGIRRLAALDLRNLRLAVSINTASESLRSEIMPINRKYPLAELAGQLRAFPLTKRGVIFIEYVLIAGINDSHEDAQLLARCLRGIPVRVNVIPLNKVPALAGYAPPDPDHVTQFKQWLVAESLFVRMRQPRGRASMAACGQLGRHAAL